MNGSDQNTFPASLSTTNTAEHKKAVSSSLSFFSNNPFPTEPTTMAPKKKPSPNTTQPLRRSPRLSTDGSSPVVVVVEEEKLPKRKKAKIAHTKSEKKPLSSGCSDSTAAAVKEVSEDEDGGGSAAPVKKIVIEHCKQCNRFKTRAALVKEGLEKAVEGVEVVVNPEKPRRGCFEVREDGDGEVFVSLLGLKRPFKPMMDLDMEQVIADIVEKING